MSSAGRNTDCSSWTAKSATAGLLADALEKKVLLFTNEGPDYLADACLIGARRLWGNGAVECPAKDILYEHSDLSKVRGGAFTLYGVLPKGTQVAVEDVSVEEVQDYDFVIFTSIQRQYETFLRLLPALDRRRTICIDGEDRENLGRLRGEVLAATAQVLAKASPTQAFCVLQAGMDAKNGVITLSKTYSAIVVVGARVTKVDRFLRFLRKRLLRSCRGSSKIFPCISLMRRWRLRCRGHKRHMHFQVRQSIMMICVRRAMASRRGEVAGIVCGIMRLQRVER